MEEYNKVDILVCDDEAEIRAMIVEFLVSIGFTCLEACDGEEAIEIMNKNSIKLAIVDVHMPIMNGLKLLAEIKIARPLFPVIMMTGFKLSQREIDIMKYKADEYIVKPFKLDQLEKLVTKLLKAVGAK